jgi:hypothetical protein
MASDFSKRAYAYFTSKGYSPHAAAALAGNAAWESTGSPTIEDPRGEGSIGLFQWRLGRRTGLDAFARERGLDPKAEETQLAYADWELNNTERGPGEQLRGATNLAEANNAVLAYLRPRDFTSANPQASHGYPQRLAASAELAPLPPSQYVGPAPEWQMHQAQAPVAPPAPPVPAINPAGLLSERYNPYASGIKTGMGLLEAGNRAGPQMPMPGLLQPYRPQGADFGLPGPGRRGLLG